ncbi:MAG: NAD(P)H-dependent glycerol-3-phosphate dehydrogenase [Alphaproteobacteria bacterium]
MRIGVIGAGSFGTALAVAAKRGGCEVVLWCRSEEPAKAMREDKENSVYLPGMLLDPCPDVITTDVSDLRHCDAIINATPAQHLRVNLERMRHELRDDQPMIIAAKGIELASGKLMSEVLEEAFPEAIPAILSGPTFAREVAENRPSAITLALSDQALAETLATAIGTPAFRIYCTDDLIGAQIGGAVKNVLAIAAGIVMGRGLGDNARAALITRGLAEMARLGVALGGKRETLMGLAGIGDLMLTASALQSRNCSLGYALGQGDSLKKILKSRKMVTEGVPTAAAVLGRAEQAGVEMPICAAMNRVLNEDADIDTEIHALLSRPSGTNEL